MFSESLRYPKGRKWNRCGLITKLADDIEIMVTSMFCWFIRTADITAIFSYFWQFRYSRGVCGRPVCLSSIREAPNECLFGQHLVSKVTLRIYFCHFEQVALLLDL